MNPRVLLFGCLAVWWSTTTSLAATNIALVFNTTYGSTISEPGERDVYVFSAATGDRLYYDALDRDFDQVYVRLISPSGAVVHINDASSDQDIGPFILTESGQYSLIQYATAELTADYQFRLLNLTSMPSLTLGATVVDQLTQRTETDILQFNGTAGQQVNLKSVQVNGSASQASWSLLSPAHVPLGFPGSVTTAPLTSDLGTVTLPFSGAYYLFVAGSVSDPTPLTYKILVTDVSEAPVPVSGLDVQRSGALFAGQTFVTNFTAPAGLPVYFDSLDRGGITLVVEVRDPASNLVFATQQTVDAGPFVLPRSGTYTLQVRGNSPSDTGLYRFRLLDLTAVPAVALNVPVTTNMPVAYQTDVSRLNGAVGQRFFYDALEADSDQVQVRLRNPDGSFVINQNSDLDRGPFTLPMSGTYFLFLESNLAGSTDYQFQLFDLAAQPVLPLDSDLAGTLSSGWSTRIYQLNATAGEQFYFDGQGSDTSGNWALYAPNDSLVASGQANIVNDFEPVLGSSGTYVLLLSSVVGSPVTYSTRVVTYGYPTNALTLGSTVSGTIAEAGEQDVYTFTGTIGQRLFYDALDGDFDPISVRLYDPAGALVFLNGNADTERGPFTLLQSGVYRLVIDGSGSTTGDYGFQLLDLSAQPPLPLDTDLTGSLNPGWSDKVYPFVATAGQQFYFDGKGSDTAGNWYLYGPNDALVSGGQANLVNDMEPVLSTAGTYVLVLSGNSASSVTYSNRVVTYGYPTNALTLGSTVSGTIAEAGEQDVYTFTGTIGQRLFYDALDGDFDPISVRLYDPAGALVFLNGNADTERGPFTLLQSGVYRLVIDGSGSTTGDYGFQLLDLSAQPPLPLDTDLTGSLNPGWSDKVYPFVATAGQQFYFDGKGSDTAGNWYLYGPNDALVSGGQANLVNDMEPVLSTAGTYVLVLSGNSASSVTYSNRVVTYGYPTNALTLGSTVSGTIAEAGEQDVYTFTGTIGQRLFYDALDGDFDPISVRLYDPAGALVFLNGNADTERGPFTLLQSGVYRLVIDGSGSTTGDYSFQLLDLSAQPPLPLDTDLTGSLNPGWSDKVYPFVATAGQQFYFDGKGSDTAGNWYLYGPNDALVSGGQANLVNDMEPVLSTAGTYVLVLSGNSASSVTYSNRVVTYGYPTNALTLGSTVSSSIAEAGEQDVYTFTGTIGQRLFYDALDGGDSDQINVRLYDPAGALVFLLNGNSDSDVLPFTLTQTGSYRLVIDPSGAVTGDYSFRLHDLAGSTGLTLGSTLNGQLATQFESDLYVFTGAVGQRINLNSISAVPGQATWYLFSPANQNLVSGNILTDLGDVVLRGAGQYCLLIQGNGGAAASIDYQVQVSDVSDTPVATSGLGTELSGGLFAGETNLTTFTAPAGLPIYFDSMDRGGVSLVVDLRDPTGALVVTFGQTADSGPIFLPRSGTYSLAVRGNSPAATGLYRFRLLDLTAVPALSLNTTLTNLVDPGYKTEILRFTGGAGQRLVYDARQSDPDQIFARLVGPAGTAMNQLNGINTDTDTGPFTLPESGTYYFLVEGNQVGPADNVFRLLDVGAQPVLPLDTPTTNVVAAYETIVHRYEGTAGQRLFLDALSPGINGYWYLYGPNDEAVVPGSPSANYDVLLPASGRYVLAMFSTAASPVSHAFQVVTYSTATNSLTLGAIVSATVSEPGERDSYTFNGTIGQRLLYDGLQSDPDQIHVYLINPSGSIVPALNFGSSDTDTGPFTLTENGTYTLLVLGNGDATGDYSFRLLDVGAQPVLPLDTPTTNVVAAYETIVHRYEGTAGQRLFLDALSPGINGYWYLYGPNDETVVPGSPSANYDVLLPASGRYVLAMFSTAASPVSHAFQVVTYSTATNSLTLGAIVSATVSEPGERDSYTFNGTIGQRLLYDGLQSDPDQIHVYLINPSGSIVPALNFGSSDTDTGPFTLTENGTYTLLVLGNGDATGDYSFRLLDVGAQPVLPLDTPTTNVVAAYETIVHRYEGTAGQRLFLDALSPGINGYWYLYGPNDETVVPGSPSANYDVLLPASGRYVLAMFSTAASPVSHAFQVVTYSTATNSLTLGAIVSATVSEPGERDSYTFNGTIGQRLLYDGLQSDPDQIHVYLINPSGSIVPALNFGSSDTDTGPFTLTENGTYTLLVLGNGDATGDYSFRLLDVGAQPVLPLDTPTTNVVAAYETIVHRYEGTAGQRLFLDALSPPFSGYWYLYGPNDEAVVPGSPGYNYDVVLPASGRYVLAMFSTAASPVSHAFQVVTLNDNPNVTANTAPILGFIGDQVIGDGVLLTFTATATDANAGDTRTFSLDPGAPPDATINPTTGVFSWVPPSTGFSSVNAVTIRVTDNGVPTLSGAQTFNITVIAGPVINSVTRSGSTATVVWRSAPGKTYRLQYKHLAADPAWLDVSPGTDVIATGLTTTQVDTTIGNDIQRYYRVELRNP